MLVEVVFNIGEKVAMVSLLAGPEAWLTGEHPACMGPKSNFCRMPSLLPAHYTLAGRVFKLF